VVVVFLNAQYSLRTFPFNSFDRAAIFNSQSDNGPDADLETLFVAFGLELVDLGGGSSLAVLYSTTTKRSNIRLKYKTVSYSYITAIFGITQVQRHRITNKSRHVPLPDIS